MDNRRKIKTRKLKEEERRKKKEGLEGGKVLFKRKDKLIRRNDIIVSPFANKIKLETGENANLVKEEEGDGEDVRGKEGVEVVTVEETVDLSEEPCVEQEGSAETGHAAEVPSAVPTVPEAGPSSQGLGISSDTTAAPMPLQETVNYLVRVVGSMGTELEKVKEKLKLSKVSPEIPPQQPYTRADKCSQDDSPNMEAARSRESRLTGEDGTGSKHCLVCYKDVPSSSDVLNDDRPLIDKQLEGIFFLNKLLCIPPTSLGKYLETCPDANPASWINLCGECRDMVTKAWIVHDEMVNASKKLKGIQEMVINKMKLSTIGTQETSVSQVASSDIAEVVTQESRKFVREHDYGYFLDPFPLGDREASQLLKEAKVRREAKRPPKSKEAQQVGTEGTSRRTRKKKTGNRISRRNKSRKSLIDEDGAFYREDGRICFRCQVGGCSKEYTSAQNYRAHKLYHSGKRPKYSCNQCDKIFSSNTGLFLHKKAIHEKNFKYRDYHKNHLQKVQRKCPHCEKITDKYTLASHIKHVHEKAFAVTCGICGDRFNHPNPLRRHQAANHGICSVEECKLAFSSDRHGLRNHQLEAHGKEINVFECEECRKLFTRKSSLLEHQRNVHKSLKGRRAMK